MSQPSARRAFTLVELLGGHRHHRRADLGDDHVKCVNLSECYNEAGR